MSETGDNFRFQIATHLPYYHPSCCPPTASFPKVASAPYSPWAAITDSPGRGRGVFATRDIPSRTCVDASPVLVFSDEEYARVATTQLSEYTFKWRSGMALSIGGFGSLFNHRRTPNVGYMRDFDSRTINFIALVPIAAGEELFICYAGQSSLWFRDVDGDTSESDDDGVDVLPRAPID